MGLSKKDKRRDYLLRRRYGIDLKQYKVMHKKQKGQCAICKRHQKQFKKRLSVDHNHKTGRIRGLLCHYCNTKLLRFLRDDRVRAKGLVAYLNRAIKADKLWKDS